MKAIRLLYYLCSFSLVLSFSIQAQDYDSVWLDDEKWSYGAGRPHINN